MTFSIHLRTNPGIVESNRLFVGTHDIMLPDCRKLEAMAEKASLPYSHREYEEMIHDWMLLTLPESIAARNEICDIIVRPSTT